VRCRHTILIYSNILISQRFLTRYFDNIDKVFLIVVVFWAMLVWLIRHIRKTWRLLAPL